MVRTVIKRNGMEVTFDKNKISNAIKKAFYDTDNKTETEI
jgi:transcriptional regulator NrdR family protein